MSDKKNVFISHIHKDDSKLYNLKQLLNKHGISARDYSITADKENNAKSPDYIKSGILAPQIDKCGAMVVYISPETKNSDWVNWEIEHAYGKDKTIVGVWELGSKGCEVPDALKKYGDAIVGWDGNKIVDAINGEFNGFDNPDGQPSGSPPIKHHPC